MQRMRFTSAPNSQHSPDTAALCRNKYEKNVINFKDPSCWNPLECRPRLFGVRLSQQVGGFQLPNLALALRS